MNWKHLHSEVKSIQRSVSCLFIFKVSNFDIAFVIAYKFVVFFLRLKHKVLKTNSGSELSVQAMAKASYEKVTFNEGMGERHCTCTCFQFNKTLRGEEKKNVMRKLHYNQ